MSNVTLKLNSSLEDIPTEVSYLLRFVEDSLKDASQLAKSIGSHVTNEEADREWMLKLMQNLRHRLVKTDVRLEDCMAIWGGYLEVANNAPVEEDAGEIEV